MRITATPAFPDAEHKAKIVSIIVPLRLLAGL
jgi:hypothetical protein